MIETTNTDPEIWRVGDLLVDVGQQRVTRDGEELALPRLSFDLLLALTRAAPNMLSPDDLMSRVWPGLVVGPETVVQRVKLLREALGREAGGASYVVTLRGRGYRLAVEAQRVGEWARDPRPAVVPEEGGIVVEPAQTASDASRSARGAAWTLVVVAVVSAGAWMLGRNGRDASSAPAAATITDGRAPVEPDAVSGERLERTVAVLPFKTLSAGPDDAFIALGLPEMALSRLSTVPGLIVVARDSSFRLGAGAIDVREAGRALNAAWLVEGSVQRSGARLRVTARLIDARAAKQVWAETFERDIARLYEVQDEIAGAVARTLQAQLTGIRRARPGGAHSDDVEAYLAYLRGRALVGRFTVAEAEAAAAQFARATELDPEFAAAHAALFDARMQAAGLRREPLAPVRAAQRASLERALALDSNDGMAQFALAMWDDLDVGSREAAFRRAALLDPSNSRGLIAFSEFLDITDGAAPGARMPGSGFDPSSQQSVGRLARGSSDGRRGAEAERILAHVLWIDPLSGRGRFREAMRGFRDGRVLGEPQMLELLELDPEFYPALQRMAKYRSINHGRPSEAIALIERAIRVDPQNPWAPHTAVAFYLDIGDAAAAREVAALTPVSRASARPLLEQHAGRVREAGAAALAPHGFEFGFNESWGFAEAVRDAALRDGRLAAAERVLRQRFGLPAGGPPQLDVANFRATVPLAHLLLREGRAAEAESLLREAIRWIGADRRFGPVYKRRTRAQAWMLLGERERALEDLAASFSQDLDYTQWWYSLEHDPVWEAARGNPRFIEIGRGVRAYISLERQAVERLREKGEVPRRGMSLSPEVLEPPHSRAAAAGAAHGDS